MTASRSRDKIVAIDVGKSKILVGVFTSSLVPLQRHRIAVTEVGPTIAELTDHIADIFENYSVISIGLALFGPLETDSSHEQFGAIVGSSEPQWSGVNLPLTLASKFAVPVFFDLDVNAGAIAEGKWGQHASRDGFIYLSVGTGIGGAFYDREQDERRVDPPQLGHLYVPREPDDIFPGSCRFHLSCLQGLASGKALLGRWKAPAHELPAHHPAWDLEARYIARACANLLYMSSPTTIIVGSGVSATPGLIERSNKYLNIFLNGFPENVLRRQGTNDFIKRATTAPNSSFMGAALLTKKTNSLMFRQPAR